MASDVQSRIDAMLATFTRNHFRQQPTSQHFADLAAAITAEVGVPVVVFMDRGTLFGYPLPVPAGWNLATK